MVETDNLEDAVQRLMNTPYQSFLAEALTTYPQNEAIDHAFSASLRHDLKRIMSFAGSEDRELLHVMVGNWDAQALKSLLRGVHNQVPPDDILRGIGPVVDFNDGQLEELANEPDPAAVISHLATIGSEWAKPLTKALVEFEGVYNLQIFEHILDHYRFTKVSKTPGLMSNSVAVEMLSQEAEIRNIIKALTSVGRDIKPDFLPQLGRPLKLVQDISNSPRPADAMAVISETSYNTILDKALPMMLMSSGHFAILERLLDELILNLARRKALEDPLSIAVPYHYLLMKHNEIMNLRLIISGLSSGMQKNALRAALILPGAA